jgi:arylsulfatase A-like enzyme
VKSRNVVASAALALAALPVEGSPPPNLIVILTDDQGYADVGFNGSRDIPTPHIDSIASNGVRFTNGYVSYSVCGPSRAGLLTGRYQGRFGFTTNPTIDPSVPHAGIPLEEKNIAEVLAPRGYHSMIVGKWHMGTHPRHHPLSRGFDEFFGFLSGGHDYFTETYTLNDLSEVTRKWEWYRTKLIHDRERVEAAGYLTDVLSRQAVDFVERQTPCGSPFFLYLAYNAPHTPLEATEEYLNRFPHIQDKKRRTYAAMVSAVDDGVGRLLAAVEESGLAEETIIFFLSDNGGALNNASSNLPLRGHKSSLWEGGVRVPFAMQWKGHLNAGTDYDAPVISLDILATIAALSNAPLSPERPLDGVNLIPYLTGEKKGVPHAQLMWRSLHNGGLAIRRGDLKLVRQTREEETPLLFDLRRDVSEASALAADRKGARTSMYEAWTDWENALEPQAFPTLADVWWEKASPTTP